MASGTIPNDFDIEEITVTKISTKIDNLQVSAKRFGRFIVLYGWFHNSSQINANEALFKLSVNFPTAGYISVFADASTYPLVVRIGRDTSQAPNEVSAYVNMVVKYWNIPFVCIPLL